MLETDGHFREKLQAANAEDIKVWLGASSGRGRLLRGQSSGRNGFRKRAMWLQPSQNNLGEIVSRGHTTGKGPGEHRMCG